MNRNTLIFNVVFALAVLIVIVFLFLFLSDNPEFLEDFVHTYGTLGLFISSIIGTATLFLPLPIDAVVLIVGAQPFLVGLQSNLLNLFIIALIAGSGAAIGEMTAYIIGLQGVKLVEEIKRKEFKSINEVSNKLKSSGAVFIFFASLTPFPFDLVGIVAGLIKYNFQRFFIAALAGKIVRYLFIAYAGFFGFELLNGWFLIA